MKSIAALALLVTLSAVQVRAQSTGEPVFGLGLSTMGATIEGGMRVTPSLGFRGMYAGTPHLNDMIEVDDIDYDVDGQLGGFALLGDFFPRGHNFRLSAGVFFSRSELNGMVTASASNPIEVGSVTFNSGETVETGAEFRNEIAPIASMGYVHHTRRNMTISAEAGVIVNNGYEISVTGTGIPQAELDAEARNIRDELDSYKVYHFVSVSVGFRF